MQTLHPASESAGGRDPKNTQRRDKSFIRNSPYAPGDSCIVDLQIPSGVRGVILSFYNNIISKRGRNYSVPFFTMILAEFFSWLEYPVVCISSAHRLAQMYSQPILIKTCVTAMGRFAVRVSACHRTIVVVVIVIVSSIIKNSNINPKTRNPKP